MNTTEAKSATRATQATEANKALMFKLFGEKKRPSDFPDRFDPNIVITQPASLPFGGTYRGLAAFEAAVPQIVKYYDFSRFELLGVYGDGDTCFASLRVGLMGSSAELFIVEQFKFSGTRVVSIRVYVSGPPKEPGSGSR